MEGIKMWNGATCKNCNGKRCTVCKIKGKSSLCGDEKMIHYDKKPYINRVWLESIVAFTYEYARKVTVYGDKELHKAVVTTILAMCDSFDIRYDKEYFTQEIKEQIQKYEKCRGCFTYTPYFFDVGGCIDGYVNPINMFDKKE